MKDLIEHIEAHGCDGVCSEIVKTLRSVDTDEKELIKRGFMQAVEMIRDENDRYGIGSMCSQWTAEDIADDIIKRFEQEQ